MTEKADIDTGGVDPRRALASVSYLLELPDVQALVDSHSRPDVLEAIRAVLDGYRRELGPGDELATGDDVVGRLAKRLDAAAVDRLRPVINATGIILHTGLGRAVLPQASVDALAGLNRCCNLQVDLVTGRRGKRNFMTERLLTRLTGAEAALVVNNNAAATYLVLAALCGGREVIVSRGQLIEIGGSFRLPDCIHQSGAVMVEVGTTNKTHVRDYEAALTGETGAILRVNPSNYRIIGFSHQVPIGDLVRLGKDRPVLVIDDLGCGALVDLAQYGLPHEPTAPESVAAGADIVCFSGDKLIGGPQAGIIVGKKQHIERIRKHPLTRMLRVGKLTDIALEHALRLFLDPDTLAERHPTLRMLTADMDSLKRRATRIQRRVGRGAPGLELRLARDESAMGGGSLPGVPISTWVLCVTSGRFGAERLAALLRRNEPPVLARISDDAVVLDMRTLLEGEEAVVADALIAVAGDAPETE